MKTYLVATSAAALIATMSIALAQTPKGEQGQKELSQPSMKEGPSGEKDTPKTGERKDAPADKKAQQDKASKDAPARQEGPAGQGIQRHFEGRRKTEKKLREIQGEQRTPQGWKKGNRRIRTRAARTPPRKPLSSRRQGQRWRKLTQEQRTKVRSSQHRGKSAKSTFRSTSGLPCRAQWSCKPSPRISWS